MYMKALKMKLLTILFLTVSYPAFGASFDKGLDCFNKKDYVCALNEWEPLSEAGNTYATGNIGHMYKEGLGVKQDYHKAIKLLREAVMGGNPEAMLNLGFMYQKGYGIEQDLFQASLLIQLSALYDNEVAQFKMGVYYFVGAGVKQDRELAKVWLKKSCHNGVQDACILLTSVTDLAGDKELLDMLANFTKGML